MSQGQQSAFTPEASSDKKDAGNGMWDNNERGDRSEGQTWSSGDVNPTPTSQPETNPAAALQSGAASLWAPSNPGDKSPWAASPSQDKDAFGWPTTSLPDSGAAVGSNPSGSTSDPPMNNQAPGPPGNGEQWDPGKTVWSGAGDSSAPGPVGAASTSTSDAGLGLGWNNFGLGPLGTSSSGGRDGVVWTIGGDSTPAANPWGTEAGGSSTNRPGSTSGSGWESPPDSADSKPSDAWNKDGSENSGDNTPWGWSGSQQGPWNNSEEASAAKQPETFAKVATKGVPITNTTNLPPNKSREEVDRERAMQDLINNHEGWGTTPIKQETKWNVEDSPQTKRRNEEIRKRAESSFVFNQPDNKMGTKIWQQDSVGDAAIGAVSGANPGWNPAVPPGTPLPGQWNGTGNWTGTGGSSQASSSEWGGSRSDWPGRSGSTSSFEASHGAASQGFNRQHSWHPGMDSNWGSSGQNTNKQSWEDSKIGTWGGSAPPTKSEWGAGDNNQWNGGRRDDMMWNSESGGWNQGRKPGFSDNDMAGGDNWQRPSSSMGSTRMGGVSSNLGGMQHMRAKMLQHLIEQGYRKEEAHDALIRNEMDIERTLAELKMGGVKNMNPGVAPPIGGKPGMLPQSLPQNNLALNAGMLQKGQGVRPPSSNLQQQQLFQQQQLVQQLRAAVHKGLISSQVLQQPLSPGLLSSVAQLLQLVQVIQSLQQKHSFCQASLNTPSIPANQRPQLVQQIQEIHIKLQQLQRQFHQLTTLINSGRAVSLGGNLPGPVPAVPTSVAPPGVTPGQENPNWQQQFQDMAISKQSKLNDWKMKESPGASSESTHSPKMEPGFGAAPGTAPGAGGSTIEVPEFVPGKPWTGLNMQKSADEDEHLTPAMVQGNKLSVTAPPSDLLDQLSRSTAPNAQFPVGQNTRPMGNRHNAMFNKPPNQQGYGAGGFGGRPHDFMQGQRPMRGGYGMDSSYGGQYMGDNPY